MFQTTLQKCLSRLWFWRLCGTINRLKRRTLYLKLARLFLVLFWVWLTHLIFICLSATFSLKEVLGLHFLSASLRRTYAFSSLWMAFSIRFFLPGSSCCVDCFCIFICAAYIFLTIFYHLWVLVTFQMSHSGTISLFSLSTLPGRWDDITALPQD